jgi:hypothetical protein
MATPADVMKLLQARREWRGSVTLSADIVAKIDSIRAEIRSGEDIQGWQKVGGAAAKAPPFRSGGFMNRSAAVPVPTRGWRQQPIQQQVQQPPKFFRSSAPAPAPAPASAPASAAIKQSAAAQPKPYTRYTSRFKNTEDTVENVVVNNIIQGKLNKFSAANYEDVREFLKEILATGEHDFLADFMKLIFHKAAMESTFCGLYAKLLFELSSAFPFLRAEMDRLYAHFLTVFEEVSDAGTENMEAFIQKNKEKKYRLGYSQFIAELYKYGVVGSEDLQSTIATILQNMAMLTEQEAKRATVEEYADCLVRITRVLIDAKTIRNEIAERHAEIMTTLKVLSPERPALSNKARFAIMDLERDLKA